jgi:transposase InsO family protein
MSGVLQRCILPAEGRSLLQDIHGGVCGHHAAPRSLVGAAFRQGFYWPSAVADAEHIVRTCSGCQYYARQTHLPARALQTIPITWPFAVWGLDMVGPLPKVPGGFTHVFVAIDKFTKWIEARALTKITSAEAVNFFKDILYSFGVPNTIITDNATQFTGKKFTSFCDEFGIQVSWSAVAHPRTNGQVERANGMVLQGLKPRVFDQFAKKIHKLGGKWAAELPSVLWSLRTTPNRGTGFSPFYMVYGAEAILLTDIDYGSPRTLTFNEEEGDINLEDAKDQLEEAREVALVRSARYQQALRRYHARHVRGRSFQIGDKVLRIAQNRDGFTKMSPPWEGPYIVTQVLRPGSYKLATPDGEPISNAWNIEQLRQFFP